jgi:hypothetical protein
MNEVDRDLARKAMVRGYHDCAHRWGASPVLYCDCDMSRIDGCKVRVEAIARAISDARSEATVT